MGRKEGSFKGKAGGWRLLILLIAIAWLLNLGGTAWAITAGEPDSTGTGASLTAATAGLGALTGNIYSSVSGEPVAGVVVSVSGKSGTTGDDGVYSITDIAVGTYEVSAAVSNFRTRKVNGFQVLEGSNTLDIALTPNGVEVGSIQGYVVDAQGGSNLNGIVITAGPGLQVTTGNLPWYNGDGYFQIDNLPLYNTYLVTATPQAGSSFLPRSQSGVIPNENVDFALTPSYVKRGSLVGTIIDADSGEPVAGVKVTAGFGMTAVTGDDGSYVLDNLLEGTYYLQAYRSGYESTTTGSEGVVVNAAAGVITQDFSLTASAAAGWVVGKVENITNDANLAGVLVTVGDKTVVTGRKPGTRGYYEEETGYYRIYGLAPGSYTLVAAKEGYSARTNNTLSIGSIQGKDISVKITPLGTPAGSLTGVVKNVVTGEAIAGAWVKAQEGVWVQTGADGSYTLTDLPSSKTYDLTAGRDGYRTRKLNQVAVGEGGVTNQNMVLTPNGIEVGTIQGYVVDTVGGNNLNGIKVSIGNDMTVTTTGSSPWYIGDGGYMIEDIPLYQTFTVIATPPEGMSYIGRSQAGVKPGESVDLALTPGYVNRGSISGMVMDSTSQEPLAGVKVTAGFGLTAVTGADGTYVLDNLPEGIYHLQVYRSGYEAATTASSGVAVSSAAGAVSLDFSLTANAAAGWVEGKVENINNNDNLAGVLVTVGDKTVVTSRRAGTRGYYEEETGYYRIYGLAPGPYTLQAAKEGYYSRETNLVKILGSSGTNVSVKVTPQGTPVGSLTGMIKNTVTGNPVAGAWVKAQDGVITLTDAGGNYTLTDLPTKNYDLEAGRDGFRTRSLNQVAVGEGGVTTQNVALTANGVEVGNIEGYVVDAVSGGNLNGVKVRIGDGLVVTTTGSAPWYMGDGSYRIDNVPLYQTFTVTATAPEGMSYLARSQTQVKPGSSADLALAPSYVNAGSITGKVTDSASGDAIQGARVTAGFGLTTVTGPDGDYVLDNLPEGSYYLQAYKGGFESATSQAKVTKDTLAIFGAQLKSNPAAGWFYGTAQRSGTSQLLNGTAVKLGDKTVLTGRKPGTRGYYSDEYGYFCIYGVAAGNYTAVAAHEGYDLVVAPVTINPLAGTSKTLLLPLGGNQPLASILSPAGGSLATGQVPIIGSAADGDFASYRLEYAPAGPDPMTWTPILIAQEPVLQGVLGQWNTTQLVAGEYVLRLTVSDEAQNTASAQVAVTIPSSEPILVTGITPTGSVEGQSSDITITGTGFQPGTIVRIGGVGLQNVVVDGDISGTLPPLLLPGTYDLEILVPERLPIVVPDAYKVAAQEDVINVYLEPDAAGVGPGGQSWVEVWVDNAINLYAMDVTLKFDPSLVQVANPESDIEFNIPAVFSIAGARQVDNTLGTVRFGASRSFDIYEYTGFEGNALLARIRFTGVTEGESPLEFTRTDLGGSTGGEGSDIVLLAPVVSHDGTITVGAVAGIHGLVDLEGVAASREDHTRLGVPTLVTLSGTTLDGDPYSDQVQAQVSGKYNFTSVPAGTYDLVAERSGFLSRLIIMGQVVETGVPVELNTVLLLAGDIGPVDNVADPAAAGNNRVDLDDLVLMRNGYGWEATVAGEYERADLDWNSEVNLIDLVLLARNFSKQGYGYQPFQ